MSDRDIQNGIVLNTEINTEVVLNLKNYANVSIIQPPRFGDVVINKKGELIYKPQKGYTGNDLIRFSYLSDRKKTEAVAVVNITENFFKPRARLLLQLGDQLIRNESIALTELVKNSFDADASICKISMRTVESPVNGEIVIEDDGVGMDIHTIKNAWLEPGSDTKERQIKQKIFTRKFHRLPIGEKGIGRFGVHKLGKHIELVSRKEDSREVVVVIDWENFAKYKYLNDAPIKIIEREPQIFKGRTGTKIIIKHLHQPWTRGMVRDVYRALQALTTPTSFSIDKKGEIVFEEEAQFKVDLAIDKSEWISDLPTWNDLRDYALFYFDIKLEGNKITKFRYKFQPWPNMTRVSERFVSEQDKPVSDFLDIVAPTTSRNKVEDVDLNNFQIGPVEFKGSIFVRDKSLLKLILNQISPVGEFLDKNGGVKVYRNGMRIYDYGEPGNDWLGLDYNRFNNPSIKVSNNMIIGSVTLRREASSDLIEKTNREGFIENAAYKEFVKAIEHALRQVEILRRQDKDRIDTSHKLPRQFEPVLNNIDTLKSLVSTKIKNPEVQKQITAVVDKIEKSYRFMNDTLQKTATIGAGWSIYIHEIEKIILEIEKVIKSSSQDRLPKLVNHLSKIIENYAQILRKTNRKSESLSKIIDQALFNIEFRLNAHKILIKSEYRKRTKDFRVNVARSLIIGTIMNMIDNSIYWLERANRKDKKIFLDIVEEKKFISVIIADNGPGFSLPFQELLEPYVTTKPDGMGLGLNIAREIMVSHEGKIDSNEKGDYHVPSEFKNGATIVLSFKR